MTSTQLTDLLAQFTAHPDDQETMFALMALYMDENTSATERQAIRKVTTTYRPIVQAMEAWYMSATTTDSAEKHLTRALAWLSMTDGYPSRDDALIAFQELIDFAKRYEIDPVPYLRYTRDISGERVRDILTEGKQRQITFRRFALMNALWFGAMIPLLVVTYALPESARLFMLLVAFLLLAGGQMYLLYRFAPKGK